MGQLFALPVKQQSLVMNKIIRTVNAQFKILKEKGQEDGRFKDFCSVILSSFSQMIRQSEKGVKGFSPEFFKFVNTFMEVLILGD